MRPILVLLAGLGACASPHYLRVSELSITALEIGARGARPAERPADPLFLIRTAPTDFVLVRAIVSNPDPAPRTVTLACVRADRPRLGRFAVRLQVPPRSDRQVTVAGPPFEVFAYALSCQLEDDRPSRASRAVRAIVPASDALQPPVI